jgi:ribonuclease D
MNINIVECENDLPADARFPNGMVAIDTETLGLNVRRDRLCLCQLADGAGNVWLVKFDGSNYSAPNLNKLLADPKILKIFHFARFDMAALCNALGTMPAPVYCTKIASRLTRTYTDRHSLKILVEEIVGESLDKNEQSSDWAEPVLTEAQKHYAASDVLYLHALKEALDEKLADRNRRDLAQACFDFLAGRVQLDLAGWDTTDIFAHH